MRERAGRPVRAGALHSRVGRWRALRGFVLVGLLVPGLAAQEVTVRLRYVSGPQETVRVPLEEYTAAVLAGEAGGIRPPEALKAIAVAIRTFAVRHRGRHRAEGFDFCDTTHCQDYRRVGVTPELREAVHATEGEILTYLGRPASTFHHRDCGGFTEAAHLVWPDSGEAYLQARPDPMCRRAPWTQVIDKGLLQTVLAREGLRVPPEIAGAAVTERSPSGRALRLRVVGAKGQATVLPAATVRFALGRRLGWQTLPSDLYELKDRGESVFVEGRGHGHGVGLCQQGAAFRAREGHGYVAILGTYYPGTGIGQAAGRDGKALAWLWFSSERVRFLTTRGADAGRVLPLADRMLIEAEAATGVRLSGAATIRLFPTLNAFRDTTGEPGWVAASTRGRTIRLQPLRLLDRGDTLASTLRHEMVHLLLEQRVHSEVPHWFREGLALALTEARPLPESACPPRDAAEETAEAARAGRQAAQACVQQLVRRHGKPAVVAWLASGLPAFLRSVPAATSDSQSTRANR